MKWDFFGFPTAIGQLYKGTEKFPEILRNLLNNINDRGDISGDLNEMILDLKRHTIEKPTIFCGGDHSISFATIPKMKKHYKNLQVLWIDAHPDCHTFSTSNTKRLHGMSMGYVLGKNDFFEIVENSNPISQDDIMMLGVRDFDDYEREFLNNSQIKIHKIWDKESFYNWRDASRPLHISLDFDCLDPSVFDATGTPIQSGFNLETLLEIIKIQENVVSWEFVEFNPLLGILDNYKILQKIISCCFDK